jgi:hypothetical protein
MMISFIFAPPTSLRFVGRGPVRASEVGTRSQSGGIGRRARLKIVFLRECGFDSHLWYFQDLGCLLMILQAFFFIWVFQPGYNQ